MITLNELKTMLHGNAAVVAQGQTPIKELEMDYNEDDSYDYTPLISYLEQEILPQGYIIVCVQTDSGTFDEYWTTYVTLMTPAAYAEYSNQQRKPSALSPHIDLLANFCRQYESSSEILHIITYDV